MKPILIINKCILQEIIMHCHMDDTLECGGYLYGKVINQGEYQKVYVDYVYYEPNRKGTESSYNFSLLYEAAAKRFADANNLSLIGCYHSHGKYNAIFSETDRNILEKHWASSKIVMIYSPSYHKLICDFVTKEKIESMMVLVMDKNQELLTIDKYLKENTKKKIKKDSWIKNYLL